MEEAFGSGLSSCAPLYAVCWHKEEDSLHSVPKLGLAGFRQAESHETGVLSGVVQIESEFASDRHV